MDYSAPYHPLVSGLYRMAPSLGVPDAWMAEQRVKRSLDRLIKTYGGAEVRRRIREAPGDDAMKARLVLMAFTAD